LPKINSTAADGKGDLKMVSLGKNSFSSLERLLNEYSKHVSRDLRLDR
jgi:hypothetical protein